MLASRGVVVAGGVVVARVGDGRVLWWLRCFEVGDECVVMDGWMVVVVCRPTRLKTNATLDMMRTK